MADVRLFQSNPGSAYQAPGPPIAWNLAWGDRDNFWGIAARPFQANNTVTLLRVGANTGNEIDHVSTDVVVTVDSALGIVGTLLRFTATRVSP
jgi:hypothetical protein